MTKKFDISTAKKIINDYADKINFYMKQNDVLRTQLEDMTTTLNINKNLLYNHILEKNDNKEFIFTITELKNENERLSTKNSEINKNVEIIESKVKKF